MNCFNLLSPYIQSHLISFLDRKSLYTFAQVNKRANELSMEHIEQYERNDLIHFARVLKKISTQERFADSPDKVSTEYLNAITHLESIQKATRKRLQDLQRETYPLLLKEFSFTSLGYPIKGLTGPRMSILASLSVPAGVKKIFSESLEHFIQQKLTELKTIELWGKENKISSLFLSTLLKVLALKTREQNGWSLTLARFSLTDQDAFQICRTVKASSLAMINLVGNSFSANGEEEVYKYFIHKQLMI